MKTKAYTLMVDVDVTFIKNNPWAERKRIATLIKRAVDSVLSATKVEVSIAEMQYEEIELIEQKLELVKPYGEYREDYFHISKVPPDIAEQLYGGDPNLDPKMAFNSSPKMKKLVDLAKQYNGTLSGFVIPVESGRNDARIQFDAIYLKCSKADAKRLRRNLRPNEFGLQQDGTYRFWWD